MITEAPSEERIKHVGEFLSGEKFPFAVVEDEKGDRLKFDPKFLKVIAAHPTPYGNLVLRNRGVLPREQMQEITQWFSQFPDGDVLRWVSDASVATKLLYRYHGTHRAMVVMCQGEKGFSELYRKGKGIKSEEDHLVGRFFVEGVENCIGIGNRTLLTKWEVERALENQLVVAGQKADVISIASGSAPAVFGAAEKYSKQGYQERMSIKAVDISKSALDDSEQMAKKLGLLDRFSRQQSDFLDVDSYAGAFKPTIVEVVGLLDYFNDTVLVSFLSSLRRKLGQNGVIIFSSVMPHHETHFITGAVAWPFMYERTKADMQNITEESGFSLHKARYIIDPLERHCMAIVQI